MTLSEMRRILTEGDIKLTKSLGQNFMHDGNQLRKIVEAARLDASDKVLEIGPGLGPLTELLLARAGSVLAIEKDRRLVEILRQRFAGATTLALLHDDGLEYLKQRAGSHDWSDWKLVANLPYSVASPILVELALSSRCPRRMVATLQMEVAQRIVSQAGDDDFGLLALLAQLRFVPVDLFKVPATCFHPEPEVASGCVVLERRLAPLLDETGSDAYVKIVKRSFSQRRKMMFKLLKDDWAESVLKTAFELAGLGHTVRAEQVTLEQFVILARAIHG
jgi:16S rRNA (adenine1518-N6/adenine1519-N6)-dimethyltransferase